jgi:hypothetical protein
VEVLARAGKEGCGRMPIPLKSVKFDIYNHWAIATDPQGGSMRNDDRPQGESRIETLEYVKSMLGQLRGMAEAEECDMLAYLIEMAHLEASDILRGQSASALDRKQRDQTSGLTDKPPGKVKLQ